jgi:hypothetical protein
VCDYTVLSQELSVIDSAEQVGIQHVVKSDNWITVVTNATGTFAGEMSLPDGNVIPPTGKAFDLEFAQTSKWEGDQLIVISAFWNSAVQRQQIGLA